jgi:hypothetical protein
MPRDVMALVWAMRGLVQAAGEVAREVWRRFLDIQLVGMRSAGPISSAPPISPAAAVGASSATPPRQLSELAPRP